jgi:hypothetical protein
VRLLAPLAADLAAWRLESGRLIGAALVFPTRDDEMWCDHDEMWCDPTGATGGAGCSIRPRPA